MPGVRIQITRFVDDSQPGFVECQFTDAAGNLRSFTEKVPVVTWADLDADSVYPQPGIVECAILSRVAGMVRVRISLCREDIECDVPASAIIEGDIWHRDLTDAS